MQISTSRRFEFGKNWTKFLSVLNDKRIAEAKKSLKDMLECEHLQEKSFLDIGSGSGLFSLAARMLGARVCSFDYDQTSIQCTYKLRQRYFPNDNNWGIGQGSVLDPEFMKSLGKFDIVYSWGVLHHTGNMWLALNYAILPVKKGGDYYIAIYNDQGVLSSLWKKVKRIYCSGLFGRILTIAIFVPSFIMACFVKDILFLRNPLKRYIDYQKSRGMSIYYDWIDWLGGYPFEVAKPEEIIHFYQNVGFRLLKMKTTNGWGNNEFVFRKEVSV
jgi:2-polyprenyl-6-hydroxyphenyl methylase/3-demethylubiquinone-9 3-methyltransferase